MGHTVQTDITQRDKVFINPNNGLRITKLKGGTEIPGSSPHQTGPDYGDTPEKGGEEEKRTEEKLEDLPITFDVPMTPKEHEEYVRWKVQKEAKDA